MITLQIHKKTFALGSALFDNFELQFEAGSFNALLAKSGAGKTSLLKILAGLDTDFEGAIHSKENTRPKVGFAFQEPRLLPWMSVLDNLLLVNADPLQCCSMLEQLDLSDAAEQYPKELSGGMQKRVSLARALLFDPEILLLDEPFSSVDAVTAELLMDVIRAEQQQKPRITVLVTHDVNEAIALADRIIVLTGRPVVIGGDHRHNAAAGHDSRLDLRQRVMSTHPELFRAN